jgi:hypothetical protein
LVRRSLMSLPSRAYQLHTALVTESQNVARDHELLRYWRGA